MQDYSQNLENGDKVSGEQSVIAVHGHAEVTMMEIDNADGASRDDSDGQTPGGSEVSKVEDGGGSKLSKDEASGSAYVSEVETASCPKEKDGDGVDDVITQTADECAIDSNMTLDKVKGSDDSGTIGRGGNADRAKGGNETANVPEESGDCGTVRIAKENEVEAAGASTKERHSGATAGGSEAEGVGGATSEAPGLCESSTSIGVNRDSKERATTKASSSEEGRDAQTASNMTAKGDVANDDLKKEASDATVTVSKGPGSGGAHAGPSTGVGETACNLGKNGGNGSESLKETEGRVNDGSKAADDSGSNTTSEGTGGGGAHPDPKKKGETAGGSRMKRRNGAASHGKQSEGAPGGQKTRHNEDASRPTQGESHSSSKVDCSNENQSRQQSSHFEDLVEVKLHAFIQPEVWNIDIAEEQPAVEVRSEYLGWGQNCAEIKLV